MRPRAPMPTLGAMLAWSQRNPRWADALVGVGAAVLLVAITALGFRDEGLDAIGYPCCAVAGLAFAVRRTHPVATFALVIGALAVFGATGQPGGPVYLATFLAASTVHGSHVRIGRSTARLIAARNVAR